MSKEVKKVPRTSTVEFFKSMKSAEDKEVERIFLNKQKDIVERPNSVVIQKKM